MNINTDNSQKTVSFNTYEKIKQDVIFGILKPSSKLKLEFLKKQYDVSVSTLREILNRLSSEGFVVAEEQKGFFVSPVSKEDLIEVANLRILLESHALKKSVKNGDTEWEGRLASSYYKLNKIEKIMQSGDHSVIKDWKQYDKEFHQATIQACRSNNLIALHTIIYEKYLRYQMLVLTFRGEEATLEHRKIFDAILERDIDEAQKILEKHILEGLNHAMLAFTISK